MAERRNNYLIQVKQAKKRFLTYDQQELICRCGLRYDEQYLYTKLLTEEYRICRHSGDLERFFRGCWVDGNSFEEVMTLLDWLCDSRSDRYITGCWVSMITLGHSFHGSLQEKTDDPHAYLFDRDPDGFKAACKALKGEEMDGGDIGYAIELMDGLRIFAQLWHGDSEFAPRLRFLWDANTTRYIRYETTWYALGLLLQRLEENMQN